MEYRIRQVRVYNNCIKAYQIDIRRWWFPFWIKDSVWSTEEKAEKWLYAMKQGLLP
jgi:hypothetical protein